MRVLKRNLAIIDREKILIQIIKNMIPTFCDVV